MIAHVGPEAAADPDLIRRLFLLRQRFWPGGGAAHPVNLPASSALRERFSRAVLGQSVKELAPYWNERYFHGTRPPPTVASEAAVVLFVERTAGGVGYVAGSRSAELPDGVRRLLCLPAPSASSSTGSRSAGSRVTPSPLP
ncbi:MAG: hypothetical protein PVI57_13150 [Gemmatimonadota bacterium]